MGIAVTFESQFRQITKSLIYLCDVNTDQRVDTNLPAAVLSIDKSYDHLFTLGIWKNVNYVHRKGT